MRKIFIFLLITLLNFKVFSEEIFYNLENKKFSYEDIVGGHKKILFIWTSNCPVCIRQLLEINRNLPLDVDCYFINLGESGKRVERVVNTLGLKEEISQNIILDPHLFFAYEFSVFGVPTVIFLKDGKVITKTYYLNQKVIKEIFKDE